MSMSDVNCHRSHLISFPEEPVRQLSSPLIPSASHGRPIGQQRLATRSSIRCPERKGIDRLAGGWLLLVVIFVFISGRSFAQTVSIFSAGTPAVVDSGSAQPLVLGVKVFSDVPGKVLGCSFYKALTNTGIHVVSLWGDSGKVLATQAATAETASGKQSVIFVSPVTIAPNQIVSCGYSAPNGHFSYDNNAFAVQKDVAPLHVPSNGGVYVYSSQATTWPTGVWQATSYGVDVLFSPSTGSTTWISGTTVSATNSAANITWNTAVLSDSQVDYGPTLAYGNSTAVTPATATAHSVAVGGLSAGTTYHFRVRSRDSDGVSATGGDHTITTVAAALPVAISTSPLNAVVASGATQQFSAIVSNTATSAVTWSASAGTINSSGLFTAPPGVGSNLGFNHCNQPGRHQQERNRCCVCKSGSAGSGCKSCEFNFRRRNRRISCRTGQREHHEQRRRIAQLYGYE